MTWSSGIWEVMRQSDGVSWLILLFLLIISVAAWSIFFYRILYLRREKKQLMKFLSKIKSGATLQELSAVASASSSETVKSLLSQTSNLIASQVAINRQKSIGEFITESQWNMIQDTMYQHIDHALQKWQFGLMYLSTTAAVAPLLGLFGTVWGLIQAFVGVSQLKTADMGAMAPGIAQALITTLVGLVVAIPALIMFNYLSSQVRSMDHLLTKLVHKAAVATQGFAK